MARGTDEKQAIIDKILEVFDGSFVYNSGKEIRIPINDVQIKVTLTCAKENVTPADETRLPGEVKDAETQFEDAIWSTKEKEDNSKTTQMQASQEEIDLVNKLMRDLNL